MPSVAALADLQADIVGNWTSIAIELRPQPAPPGSPGAVVPQWLTRQFTYRADGSFVGKVRMYADPQRVAQLSVLEFGGHLRWQGPHPVAPGAFAVDYVCDTVFAITPLAQPVADAFNSNAQNPGAPFAVGRRTSLLSQDIPADGPHGQGVIVDYDLLYLRDGYLFMGAKHVDGSQFDTADARPSALQIPLVKAETMP